MLFGGTAMPVGPGKYDDLCTHVRELSKAEGVIVIVFNGVRGSGFSVQAEMTIAPNIPELLEQIASDMRAVGTPK
jgi:hypothetical protein